MITVYIQYAQCLVADKEIIMGLYSNLVIKCRTVNSHSHTVLLSSRKATRLDVRRVILKSQGDIDSVALKLSGKF